MRSGDAFMLTIVFLAIIGMYAYGRFDGDYARRGDYSRGFRDGFYMRPATPEEPFIVNDLVCSYARLVCKNSPSRRHR